MILSGCPSDQRNRFLALLRVHYETQDWCDSLEAKLSLAGALRALEVALKVVPFANVQISATGPGREVISDRPAFEALEGQVRNALTELVVGVDKLRSAYAAREAKRPGSDRGTQQTGGRGVVPQGVGRAAHAGCWVLESEFLAALKTNASGRLTSRVAWSDTPDGIEGGSADLVLTLPTSPGSAALLEVDFGCSLRKQQVVLLGSEDAGWCFFRPAAPPCRAPISLANPATAILRVLRRM